MWLVMVDTTLSEAENEMTTRHGAKGWNLIVDVAKCENCNNCTLAVRDEYIENDFPGYSAAQPKHGHHWIKISRRVRGDGPMVDAAYLPTSCNHCDNAPCIKAGGEGVVRKRQDGIVIIDPERAKGRRDLVEACPYGAIWWNEERQLPQIWTFDAHLLDQGWTEPRCVQVCPTRAMRALNIDGEAMKLIADAEKLSVLLPELQTAPRVYYKNLYRFDQDFVGGTVIGEVSGVVECLHGAQIVLSKGGKEQARTTSDLFGEFKFDGLSPDGAKYALQISKDGFDGQSRDVTLSKSTYLGRLQLEPTKRANPGQRQPDL
ncbi:4Fe-4S dicluster domain-containing protein [Sulfuritalea sp.]|uniref:4Fe-4S dicluster domain-containing protein n=1 Tax=Sulfuritalea sp. TaxID=2480090 RepID=UPI001AD4444B|nr:4Fe-4S dicluster domain-containing protein [Sulfuritalea sp.]MBN8476320.1 carboxypeptidase regulatory-like domain-containing protein [Sulfuritalea sp.]